MNNLNPPPPKKKKNMKRSTFKSPTKLIANTYYSEISNSGFKEKLLLGVFNIFHPFFAEFASK